MLFGNLAQTIVASLLRPFFKQLSLLQIDKKSIENISVYWPNTELGILFSAKSVFTSIKKSFPNSQIKLIIDSRLLRKMDGELLKLILELAPNDIIVRYNIFNTFFSKSDLVFVPSFDSFSTKSHFFAAITLTNNRAGVERIDDLKNKFSFLFNYKSKINLMENQDIHVSEILFNQLKFLNISFNFSVPKVEKEVENKKARKIILLNNEPEVKHNRWDLENMLGFISKLVLLKGYYFYIIENGIEKHVKDILEKDIPFLQFLNKNNYKKLVEIIPRCDLIVSCNSDLMHLAGLFDVPQISIFGLENPFQLSPIGTNKKFLRNSSQIINEVTADEVYELSQKLLRVKN